MEVHDLFIIDATHYPSVFKAFELISHDCGRQAGHKNYGIPLKWQKDIDNIEYNLKQLLLNADSDFDCLCIGDETDRNRIVEGYKLHVTDKLLQEFFEEFC